MKIWFSIFNRKAYVGNEPSFYSADQFKWRFELENNWRIIEQELNQNLSSNSSFFSGNTNQRVNNHGKWKTLPLMTWGVQFQKNIQHFPLTTEILERIPGLVSASFNLLEKNSEIGKHFGETNASYRIHLGLQIPGNLPEVGMQVINQSMPWENGKIIAFCDGHEHTAWNHSGEDRYILLLDVIRPEFLRSRRWVCGNVLAMLSLQSITLKSKPWFYLIFIPLIILHFLGTLAALVLTPLYNISGSVFRRKKSE